MSIYNDPRSLVWIFTIGDPEADLMLQLRQWVGLEGTGGLRWIVVPVKTPGVTSLSGGEFDSMLVATD